MSRESAQNLFNLNFTEKECFIKVFIFSNRGLDANYDSNISAKKWEQSKALILKFEA